MNRKQFIAACRACLDDAELQAAWDAHLADPDRMSDVPPGFFSWFRPDGSALKSLFDRVKKGGAAYERLLEIYAATAPGYDPARPYFLVVEPQPTWPDELIAWGERHLVCLAAMADCFDHNARGAPTLPVACSFDGDRDYPPLRLDCRVVVEHRAADPYASDTSDVHEMDTLLWDYLSKIHTPNKLTNHLHELAEPLYQMTAHLMVPTFVLWPYYSRRFFFGHKVRDVDPVRPLIELWKRGAEARFRGRDELVIYCPHPFIEPEPEPEPELVEPPAAEARDEVQAEEAAAPKDFWSRVWGFLFWR